MFCFDFERHFEIKRQTIATMSKRNCAIFIFAIIINHLLHCYNLDRIKRHSNTLLLPIDNTVEWDSSQVKSDAVASVQHANCSFSFTLPPNLKLQSAATYVVISRLHCAMLCTETDDCFYFLFERNIQEEDAEPGYPTYNVCYIFTTENDDIKSFFVYDPNLDVCVMTSEDVVKFKKIFIMLYNYFKCLILTEMLSYALLFNVWSPWMLFTTWTLLHLPRWIQS
ncbi:hypothetical protein CHUAL_002943 [Chamberlinius hualienensis]